MQDKKISFERAIFISWYCSLGNCAYCYMSSQKNLIKDPKKARRSEASILAEAIICRKLGWKIGFLSAGYGSFDEKQILDLVKKVYSAYGEKLWLNIGVLDENAIKKLSPYLEGICGAVETADDNLRKKVCPGKSLAPIEKMFEACNKLNLKKAMTFIIGLGETTEDFNLLKKFIIKNKIDKIIFYALNPIKGTIFEKSKGPKIEYFIEWIRKTREQFPKIKIVAGHWVNRVNYIHLMIDAGANSITKFPAIKLFNSKFAKTIENEIKKSNMVLEGTFTKVPEIEINNELDKELFDDSLSKQIKIKLIEYVKQLKKRK